MSTTVTLMEFPWQKVESVMRLLSSVQIVATPSRQFHKTIKLRQGSILSFQILPTLSTKLVRPAFNPSCAVAGVSFAFLIEVNDA